jgi:hypothetical protein
MAGMVVAGIAGGGLVACEVVVRIGLDGGLERALGPSPDRFYAGYTLAAPCS